MGGNQTQTNETEINQQAREAWDAASATCERGELYASDGNHASSDGSYLNACVFYALITGESPEANSDRLEDSSSIARQLELAAWKAVKEASSSQEKQN